MNKQILITGGAGYIGIHITLEFLKKGFNVTVVDDLKNSYVCYIKKLQKTFHSLKFIKGDVCDPKFIDNVFMDNDFDTVVHLAAKKIIGESIQKPRDYFSNNMNGLECMLKHCKNSAVKTFVFASTVTVYGNSKTKIVNENCELSPLNPYAETKILGEKMVEKWQKETGKNSLIFRFSNPIGADCEFMLGEHGKNKKITLLSYIIDCILNEKPATFRGNSFKTHDGSAVRNYIHVSDLARIVANTTLSSNKSTFEILNLGNKDNHVSVLDLVHVVEKHVGKKLNFSFTNAGEEEIGATYIDSSKLIKKFGESCNYNLDDIVESQLKFYKHIQKNRK